MSTTAKMLEDLAEEQGWVLNRTEDGSGFLIAMATTDDRSQSVHVEFREDEEGACIAAIWSEIAEAGRFAEPWQLLDFNWTNSYGSLARREGQVVLIQNQLVDSADPEEVARAISYVGRIADAIESEVTGGLDLN